MAFGANTPWLIRVAAAVLASVLALLLAAAGAEQAQAGSPCARYGDVRAEKLRTRQARAAIRCFLNRERGQRGVGKLERDRRLQKAAQRHTELMLKQDCFSHQCPGESTLESRLRSAAYLIGSLLRWSFGENIAYGTDHYGTPKAIVRAWMNSPGHKANILNSSFEHLGVGFVHGTPGSPRADGGTYTTDFGMRSG